MAGAETIHEVLTFVPKDYTDVIETGTFLGHATKRFADKYDTVHTIELDDKLSKFAEQGMKENGYENITCWVGDSAEILPKLISDYNKNFSDKKVLFYLDAHWSGDESVKEYKDGWSGPMSWIGNYTAHKGKDNNPTSQEQVPLEEELLGIYNNFKNECVICVDDYDKFDEDGKGLSGVMFEAEDWSHINLSKIFISMSDRVVDMFSVNNRLVIKLKEKNVL
jgi:hypothetical protein